MNSRWETNGRHFQCGARYHLSLTVVNSTSCMFILIPLFKSLFMRMLHRVSSKGKSSGIGSGVHRGICQL